MWTFLYNASLFLYGLAIRISSLFNHKAAQWINGRQFIFESLQQRVWNETIWFHCASVGEFEQGYPLIKQLQKRYPSSTLLVTFFSPSGYEFAKKRYTDFHIFYLPIDSKQHAMNFLDIIKPKAAFFIKYEFWFHYLSALHTRQIPTFLISGIFRKDQPFFTWYGPLHRQMLRSFTYLFLQNKDSKTLLDGIGITNSIVVGDTRFDRVAELKDQLFHNEIIDEFVGDAKVFVAGSMWPSDEDTLKNIISMLPATWKIIVFPHEIDHFNSSWLIEEPAYYTRFTTSNKRVLVVDTLGLLSRVYRKATLVYIGGGYGKGIHNMLEAAIYEVPVLIGPRFQKFNEAVELTDLGIAFDTSKKETKKVISQLVENDQFYATVKKRYALYMAQHANVSENIDTFICEKKLVF